MSIIYKWLDAMEDELKSIDMYETLWICPKDAREWGVNESL